MTLPLIISPLSFTPSAALSSDGSGLQNIASPSPREAFVTVSAGATLLTVELNEAQLVDTVFLGFTNLPAATVVELFSGQDFATPIGAAIVAHSYRRNPARHAFAVLPAPIELRYIRLRVTAPTALVVGVLAVGLAMRPGGGTEQDWGRPISDPSTVTRLLSGALSVGDGVATGGYAWTMAALSDEERDRLYALQLDLGIGETLLVLEQEDATAPGANETAHWSKLTKLEPFARQAPGATKWAMQVQDWS